MIQLGIAIIEFNGQPQAGSTLLVKVLVEVQLEVRFKFDISYLINE